MTTTLPDGFLPGAAATAHQIEGTTHDARGGTAVGLLHEAAWITTPGPVPVPGERPAYTFRNRVTVPPFHAASIAVTPHGIYKALSTASGWVTRRGAWAVKLCFDALRSAI